MSDMLQSTLRSPRWQALQRTLAESFAAPNANANGNGKVSAASGGSWLARVRCRAVGKIGP